MLAIFLLARCELVCWARLSRQPAPDGARASGLRGACADPLHAPMLRGGCFDSIALAGGSNWLTRSRCHNESELSQKSNNKFRLHCVVRRANKTNDKGQTEQYLIRSDSISARLKIEAGLASQSSLPERGRKRHAASTQSGRHLQRPTRKVGPLTWLYARALECQAHFRLSAMGAPEANKTALDSL